MQLIELLSFWSSPKRDSTTYRFSPVNFMWENCHVLLFSQMMLCRITVSVTIYFHCMEVAIKLIDSFYVSIKVIAYSFGTTGRWFQWWTFIKWMKYLFKFKCDPLLSDFISIVCIHNILFSIKDGLSFWMLSNLPLFVLFFQYNFVGRILGPRGLTAKQLEAETGCKIMVRGRSSMRDRKKVSHATKH